MVVEITGKWLLEVEWLELHSNYLLVGLTLPLLYQYYYVQELHNYTVVE